MLSVEDIINADDLGYEEIEVPEWGGIVRVRMLTGAERDAWEADQSAEYVTAKLNKKSNSLSTDQYKKMNENLKAKFCALCMVKEDGSLLFEDQKSGAEILGRKSSSSIDKVFTAAQKLNRVSDEDIQEMEKNSDGLSDE